MSASAHEQVERMLALVPYLRSRDGISVDEVARDFGVPPSQIVKDLKVLWYCGLPNSVTGDMIDIDMEALDGDGIVKLSNADYLTRPLRLAPHEALAMMVALRALRETSGSSQRETVDRTLAKLEAATGESAAPASAVDIHVDQHDDAIRASVDQALATQRRLHLRYYVPGRDETTERDADPIRLVFSEGHGYLEAYCYRAGEVRLFRIDRITAAEVLDQPAEPPEGLGLHDLSKGLFQPDPEDALAVLDLQPAARWVSEYYPIEREQELGDGRLRVELRFSDERWLQRLVMRLGGAASVVQPESVASAVRDRARAALAQYSA
ncbi:MAG TPA: WYL domain-containing protein [Nocardioidaceae bacterium]|jgi:proteasome accessory factor C